MSCWVRPPAATASGDALGSRIVRSAPTSWAARPVASVARPAVTPGTVTVVDGAEVATARVVAPARVDGAGAPAGSPRPEHAVPDPSAAAASIVAIALTWTPGPP